MKTGPKQQQSDVELPEEHSQRQRTNRAQETAGPAPRNAPPNGQRGNPNGLRNPNGQAPSRPAQPNQQQRILRMVGLTSEQQQRLGAIRQSHQPEIAATGRRVRNATGALDSALYAATFDQAEYDRATEELAQARAAQVRLNSKLRAEIRQVLTPEQVKRYKDAVEQIRQEQIQQRLDQLKDNGNGQRPPGQAEVQNPANQGGASIPNTPAPAGNIQNLDLVSIFLSREAMRPLPIFP